MDRCCEKLFRHFSADSFYALLARAKSKIPPLNNDWLKARPS
jgi:hypothetical protein